MPLTPASCQHDGAQATVHSLHSDSAASAEALGKLANQQHLTDQDGDGGRPPRPRRAQAPSPSPPGINGPYGPSPCTNMSAMVTWFPCSSHITEGEVSQHLAI